jgi:hypothetical protein
MTPDQRREHIRRVVDQAPELSPDRLAQLRELLREAVAVVHVRRGSGRPEAAA